MNSQDQHPAGRRDAPLYLVLAFAWLLFTLASISFAVHDAWERVERDFAARAEKDIDTLRDRLRSNETLLDGFAAFLGIVESPSRAQLAGFASRTLAGNPHIYMLEVVQKVPASARAEFERTLAAQAGAGRRISRFDYQAGRSWAPVADKAVYYPISFIWPETPESRPVLGLDLDAVPHLRDTMRRADLSGAAVASQPFALIEGPLAYVMLKQADRSPPEKGKRDVAPRPERYALLVVKGESLQPASIDPYSSHTLRALGDRGPIDPPLVDVPAQFAASALERRLLPRVRVTTMDFGTSQPVRLSMSRQLRFADISAQSLGLAILLSALSLLALVLFVRRHRAAALREHEAHRRARHHALHDALTGLANRRLLLDRVELALAHWRRTGEGFALFFVDLDKFKEVNDQHGHDAGDAVLRAVAQRMRNSVRETDTVARIAGDEFVVLIPGITERVTLQTIADKVLAVLAQPVEVRTGLTIVITGSLGISLCPDDGCEPDALLKCADAAMYDSKRGESGAPGPTAAPRLRLIRKADRMAAIQRKFARH
ncbi:sensor domain-containing diguanylate cyclase [Aromatoleum diolicum]|uniref:Diguanylate cyclase n=1 Tax=Aromatoleum diolicum TaxID=75796 RepID=A0ABX1QBM3_9RHOO|nr:sensor domain-containing diguanylate cyclase [Aromatoleum diolicum]NMG75787.1 diguanylate cyclase [Aromatoleum diolicum]